MNKSRRKLVRKELLVELAELSSKGVPIARLIADNNLDMSIPCLAKLIKCYFAAKEVHSLFNSIFPIWLKSSGEAIQIQPDNWKYTGLFPFGTWSEREDGYTKTTV